MSENDSSHLPAEQRPLLDQGPASWPQSMAATGDSGTDEALRALESLAQTPTAEHPELYQQVYDKLLAELETGPEETGTRN